MEIFMKIHEFRKMARELLILDTENNVKPILDYYISLSGSISIFEQIEAAIIDECFKDTEILLKYELKFLEDYYWAEYFEREKKTILQNLDIVFNPDNYPTETLLSKRPSLSEKTLKEILRALKTELISSAKMPA
jgi:hypothetical protein